MGLQVVDAHARSAAPRDAVWELVADGVGWARWGTWTQTTLEREGTPAPDGVGGIRRMLAERRFMGREVVAREEVTVFQPPALLGYRLLSGLPLRDYEGRIELTDDGGGTRIRWRTQFHARIPGTGGLFRQGLQRLVQDLADRLARAAEAPAPR